MANPLNFGNPSSQKPESKNFECLSRAHFLSVRDFMDMKSFEMESQSNTQILEVRWDDHAGHKHYVTFSHRAFVVRERIYESRGFYQQIWNKQAEFPTVIITIRYIGSSEPEKPNFISAVVM
jgi:hypothetical protein